MRYYNIQVSGGASSTSIADASGAADVTAPIGGSIDFGNLPVLNSIPTGGRNITVNKPVPTQSGASSGLRNQWSSLVNGVNDPGALDILFDITLAVGESDLPSSAHIQIFGVPFELVTQANNFNTARLQMWGGYSPGLPLANDQVSHQGLLVDGVIYPAFGNWIGDVLSIDFIVKPSTMDNGGGTGGPTDPKNIIHNMPANMPLATALRNTLGTAFPSARLNINISPKLVLGYPDYGFYQSLQQLNNYVRALSFNILGTPEKTGYNGVSISAMGNVIKVDDGTVPGNPIRINYQDLVGQPTWIGLNKIQVTTVLRGDIGPTTLNGGTAQIILPPTLTTQTEIGAKGSFSEGGIPGLTGNVLSFTGTWDVQTVRHVGRFRDPTWSSWITIIEAVQNNAGASATGDHQVFNAPQQGPGGPNPTLRWRANRWELSS